MAVRAEIPGVPVKFRFNVPEVPLPLIKPPKPLKAAVHVTVPLLVTLTDVFTVRVAKDIAFAPLKVAPVVSIVVVPVRFTVPALLAIPDPRTVKALAALLNVPPLSVTMPVNFLFAEAPARERVPPEIAVVPLTVKATAPVVRFPVVIPTERFPFTVRAVVIVQAVDVPVTDRLPRSGVVGVQVFVVVPLKPRL